MDLNKTQKIVLVVALLVVGVGILTGGIYYTWLITPPGPPKTAEEGVKTMASARFARMPDYRKSAYMEQTRKLAEQLPEDKRRELFHQMRDNDVARREMEKAFQAQMMTQVKEYAKASPADRLKLLDAAIDREEQMRGMFGGRGPGGPGGRGDRGPRTNANRPPGGPGGGAPPGGGPPPGGPRGGNFRERMRQRIEHGNPQSMALMTEFRRAMQQRRAQRGLPAGRP